MGVVAINMANGSALHEYLLWLGRWRHLPWEADLTICQSLMEVDFSRVEVAKIFFDISRVQIEILSNSSYSKNMVKKVKIVCDICIRSSHS